MATQFIAGLICGIMVALVASSGVDVSTIGDMLPVGGDTEDIPKTDQPDEETLASNWEPRIGDLVRTTTAYAENYNTTQIFGELVKIDEDKFYVENVTGIVHYLSKHWVVPTFGDY